MEDKKDPRGRKKVVDKKVPLRVYVFESQLQKMGGVIEAHQLVMKYIERFKSRR